MRWLVDAMNVIGSRPDGWWRDRAGAARGLTAKLQRLADESGDQILVAFEGQQLPDLPEGRHRGVTVLYACRRGQNAADDRIVEEVSADTDPASLTVVTSDRDLARRVRDLGASVVGPGVLLHRLAPQPERTGAGDRDPGRRRADGER